MGRTGKTNVLRAPASEMVHFAAGDFFMGSTEEHLFPAIPLCARESVGEVCDLPIPGFAGQEALTLANVLTLERGFRRLTLSGYWLDRLEVTVAEYDACVERGECARVPFEDGAARFRRPSMPVTMVTLDDAARYCRARGKRLPTEAEWERAARGRSGRVYPWGSVYNRHLANHGTFLIDAARLGPGLPIAKVAQPSPDGRDGALELAEVGSYPDGATPEGVLDLAGNVAEWVEDVFAPYDPKDTSDPRHPGPGVLRVVRGGSFLHPAPFLRGSARLVAESADREVWIGFRCAKSG